MSEVLYDKTDPKVPQPILPRPRLTVVETLYYQPVGSPPVDVTYSGAVFLEEEEQVYSRRVTVKQEWTRLDCGWLKDRVAFLVLRNEEGRFTQVNPTPEDREEARNRVVLVGVKRTDGEGEGEPVAVFAQVLPGDPPLRIRPTRPESLWLCCSGGEAKVTLTLIPR